MCPSRRQIRQRRDTNKNIFPRKNEIFSFGWILKDKENISGLFEKKMLIFLPPSPVATATHILDAQRHRAPPF